MTLFYSPTTTAFYDDDLWPHEFPADVVEVSAERHAELMAAVATGLIIALDDDGKPQAIQPPPLADETLAEQARRRRDVLIASVRWMTDRHADELALELPTSLSAEAILNVRRYVQALRDLPLQPNFPAEIAWPVLPSNLTTETL